MTNETNELLKFSVWSTVAGDRLVGTWRRMGAGSAGLTEAGGGVCHGMLGEESVGGTVTGALRQFNLPTSRAPGDWPEPAVHTVRY